MVDLSKHLARAKQAIERRNYEMAIEITLQCQEVDPANLENYQLLLDAAKRRAREGGKKGFGIKLGFSKDPHKQLSTCVKAVTKNPDIKTLLAAGDAAYKLYESGVKSALDAAILFYREGKATGMFNQDLLWNLGHALMEQFKQTNDPDPLEQAIETMAELHRNDKSHGEAARTLKNWEAMRSMARRNEGGQAGDYRSQLASGKEASRNEVMNRIIRTAEDAKEVLAFVDADLQNNPDDKALWLKKGDVHRRVGQFKESKAAYDKAAEVDPHDFVVTMRQGDVVIASKQAQIKQAKQQGQDTSQAEAQLARFEIEEYRKRAESQPTEMSHRYHLGLRLFQSGEVDEAASEFQQAVKDPRYRRQAHNFLGHCFAKKNLLDLAAKQFTECLSLIEDSMSDDHKEVLYNRARVYEAGGNTEAAIADFTQVVEQDLGYKDAADRLSQLRS